MNRYRVEIEFSANNDSDARSIAGDMLDQAQDESNEKPTVVRLFKQEFVEVKF